MTAARKLAPGLGALAIVALIAAAYAGTRSVPFLLDDYAGIVGNGTLRHLGDIRSWALRATGPTAGRPLLNLSFALNFAAGGLRVAGYHWANLAIHAAAAVVLFGLVRRTLAGAEIAPRLRACAGLAAGSAAALWALHPLATEAVTYLSQRAESLMGLCLLFALYALARGWLTASVVAVWAGMLTKETMASAPLILWLYDRCFLSGTFAAAWRRRRGYYVASAAAWLCLIWSLHGSGARGVGYSGGMTTLAFARTEAVVVLRYLGLCFWPHPLIFDYGPWTAGWSAGAPCLVAVAGLLGAAGWLLVRRPAAGFVGAAFFLLLAPTSSLIPIAAQPMAESRVYLPLAAVMAGAMALIYRTAGPRAIVAVAALVAVAGFLTARRNASYRDPVALWRITAAERPANFRAHTHLGLLLSAAGDSAGAEAEERAALALRPEDPDVLNDLGLVLEDGGKFREAEIYLGAAVRRRPQDAAARFNLGRAEAGEGRLDAAERDYRRALELDPSLEPARNQLALLLQGEGRQAEAAGEYQTALALPESDPHARAVTACNFALLLSRQGAWREAEAWDRRALASEAGLAPAWGNLGVCCAEQGRPAEAAAAFREQLRLDPNNAGARSNLAAVRKGAPQ